MKIEHLAIWVHDLEAMKEFYTTYFNLACSPKYVNHTKNFTSYFLAFPEGARIELMHKPGLSKIDDGLELVCGLAHFAISLGSKEKVDQLTGKLKAAGFTIKDEPRTTGDGYYESVVLDPEGNQVEITV